MHFLVLNKRNREFWENQEFWVLLLWRLVAEGKSDAIFWTSIDIFPYSYIVCLDGIILDRIVMDFKLIYYV